MVKNIYENKRYKLYVVLPIALLLISLYFIPRIPLDSSLRGGVAVQLQTSGQVNTQNLTSFVNAHIAQAQASVSVSPGGVSVTITTNASLAAAQDTLVNIYTSYSNYSRQAVLIATYQNTLKAGANATAQAGLTAAQANETTEESYMAGQTQSLLTTLAPLLNNQTYSYNSTNPAGMLTAAKNAYANASTNYETMVLSVLHAAVPFTSYSYNEVTPTLGAFFLGQMLNIIVTAFILVAIAVFFVFRTPIPSLSVVFGAGNDILVALGLMGLFGIPLGVASIGGLLMLIGYSIDTDMLSAIRILKRTEGTPAERAFSTLKTGLTMTFAAIISFGILLTVSYVAFIPTYFEIASVVLFGLIADIFTTWFGNTVLVLWYKQRKESI
jgi:preprotein translocase subunit SecF